MKLLRKQISVCIFWFSLSCKGIVDFHCTVMRPVLEYRSSIFHHTLPDCLSERVQKRALSIIAPDKSYKHCLVSFGLSTLYDRRNDQCIKQFNSISSDQDKFACLLSPNHQGYYTKQTNKPLQKFVQTSHVRSSKHVIIT